MLDMERRWALEILEAFAPEQSDADGFAPRPGEVDYLLAYDTFREQATPLAATGVRAAVWLLYFSPSALGDGARSLSDLEPQARSVVLDELSRHRVFALREATFLLKMIACLALFEVPRLRELSGHGTPPAGAHP